MQTATLYPNKVNQNIKFHFVDNDVDGRFLVFAYSEEEVMQCISAIKEYGAPFNSIRFIKDRFMLYSKGRK